MANLLVEGGSQLLGSFFDQGLINEVHTFIAPILLGGNGLSAIGGHGVAKMAESWKLEDLQVEQTGGDIYLQGHLPQPKNPGNVTLRHPS
jgi:diaminohydroxyphosphoribosylaminopyrimidine deaminase/5-amino-6-(5-phosphoribosylamino)uracil reductase